MWVDEVRLEATGGCGAHVSSSEWVFHAQKEPLTTSEEHMSSPERKEPTPAPCPAASHSFCAHSSCVLASHAHAKPDHVQWGRCSVPSDVTKISPSAVVSASAMHVAAGWSPRPPSSTSTGVHSVGASVGAKDGNGVG